MKKVGILFLFLLIVIITISVSFNCKEAVFTTTTTYPIDNVAIVSHQGASLIAMYNIDSSSGEIQEVNEGRVSLLSDTYDIATDSSGEFIFVSHYIDDTLSVIQTDKENVTLDVRYNSSIATEKGPIALKVHPTLPKLYVANFDMGIITSYDIDASDGNLTNEAEATGSQNPCSMDISGSNMYVADNKKLQIVYYTLDPLGAMTYDSTIGISDTNQLFKYVITSGDFLYAASVDSSDATSAGYISVFDISGGTPTEIVSSPFTAGYAPSKLAFNLDETVLYAANYNGTNISVYDVNTNTGVLTETADSPVDAPNGPISLVPTPDGKFLFATSDKSDEIYTFKIESNTITRVDDATQASLNNPRSAVIIPFN